MKHSRVTTTDDPSGADRVTQWSYMRMREVTSERDPQSANHAIYVPRVSVSCNISECFPSPRGGEGPLSRKIADRRGEEWIAQEGIAGRDCRLEARLSKAFRAPKPAGIPDEYLSNRARRSSRRVEDPRNGTRAIRTAVRRNGLSAGMPE